MANKTNKKVAQPINISITPDEIIGSEINRNGDYKYASIVIKKSDNEYMRISYEWKDDINVPEFVMSLMSWITSARNDEEVIKFIEEHTEEYDALKERL